MLEAALEHPLRTLPYLDAGRSIGTATVTAGPIGFLHTQVLEVTPEPLDTGNTKNTTGRAGTAAPPRRVGGAAGATGAGGRADMLIKMI